MRILFPVCLMLVLGACDPDDNGRRSDDDKIDDHIEKHAEKAEDKLDKAGEDIKDAAKDAGQAVEGAAKDVGAVVENGVATAGDAIDDAALVTAVKAALVKDKDLSALAIGVSAESGVVTLTGKVASLGLKMHATDIVNDVKGVSRVQNRIEING